MRTRSIASWLLGLSFVIVTACGDDPALSSPDGSIQSDGSMPDASDSGAPPVACGNVMCEAFEPNNIASELTPEACCISPGVCGVTNQALFGPSGAGCIEVVNNSLPEECPSENIEIAHFATALAGCCRPDHACGLRLNLVGSDYGCIERAALASAITGGLLANDPANPPAWTSTPCSAFDHDAGGGTGGVGGDGGTGGTGGTGGVGGDGGTGGTGDLIGACVHSASYFCEQHNGTLADVDPLVQGCSQTAGVWTTSCSTADVIAECAYPQGPVGTHGTLYYYEGIAATEEQLREGCDLGLQGTFVWY